MQLTDFVKDAPNLKALFKKLKDQKIIFSLYEIGSQVDLKLHSLPDDYCVVQTSMKSGVVGTSRTLVHPYGSSVGYMINLPSKDDKR